MTSADDWALKANYLYLLRLFTTKFGIGCIIMSQSVVWQYWIAILTVKVKSSGNICPHNIFWSTFTFTGFTNLFSETWYVDPVYYVFHDLECQLKSWWKLNMQTIFLSHKLFAWSWKNKYQPLSYQHSGLSASTFFLWVFFYESGQNLDKTPFSHVPAVLPDTATLIVQFPPVSKKQCTTSSRKPCRKPLNNSNDLDISIAPLAEGASQVTTISTWYKVQQTKN